jgi:hypothetical protein
MRVKTFARHAHLPGPNVVGESCAKCSHFRAEVLRGAPAWAIALFFTVE